MTDNVFIKHYRYGKLVEERRGHNVWVDQGRAYLAALLEDPPAESRRVKFMGVGIGGN